MSKQLKQQQQFIEDYLRQDEAMRLLREIAGDIKAIRVRFDKQNESFQPLGGFDTWLRQSVFHQ